jgi:Mor family transcriptional regulator
MTLTKEAKEDDFVATMTACLSNELHSMGLMDEASAVLVAESVVFKFCMENAAQRFYVKKQLVVTAELHQHIFLDYDGHNLSAVAKKYRVSQAWALEVIRRMRKKLHDGRQRGLEGL